jgi:UDP-glucose 4-epimerase
MGLRPSVDIFGTDYPTPDGTCIRDYIHVVDLASAHVLAVDALRDGRESTSYNLGTGTGNSVLEVIETVSKVSGRDVPTRKAARRPGDPPRLVASSEKIRKELGWRPEMTTLTEIVETAWRFKQRYPRGYGEA